MITIVHRIKTTAPFNETSIIERRKPLYFWLYFKFWIFNCITEISFVGPVRYQQLNANSYLCISGIGWPDKWGMHEIITSGQKNKDKSIVEKQRIETQNHERVTAHWEGGVPLLITTAGSVLWQPIKVREPQDGLSANVSH